MLSVIIPVFNGEKYLKRCLDSLINQSYKDIEIIIIDNMSTDGSYEICKQYLHKFSNVRLFWEKKNGAAAARNRGLLEASGEYITFVDCDDYVEFYSYEVVMNNLDPNVDLVCFSFNYVDKDGQILNWYVPNLKKYNNKVFFSGTDVAKIFLISKDIEGFCWNKIFKKSIFIDNDLKFDENKKSFEDMSIVFNAICYCQQSKLCDYKIINYRQTNSSLSHQNYEERYDEYMDSIGEIVKKATNVNLELSAKVFFSSRYIHMLYNALKKGDLSKFDINLSSLFNYLVIIIKYELSEKLKTVFKTLVIIVFFVCKKGKTGLKRMIKS